MIVRAVYDGKAIRPDERGKAKLEKFKSKLKPEDTVAIRFEDWGSARSHLQQALLHSLISRYSRKNQEALETVKVRWKVRQGHYVPAGKILDGEIDLPPWRGKWVDLQAVDPDNHAEQFIVFLRSESDYTTRMEADFIEYAIAQCQGSGVNIEDILESLSELRK